MIVTDIVEINSKKCKVYIDMQFAFALYKGELCSYHIKKDCELSQQDYETITKEVLPKRAKLRVMNLLKERSYTKGQLVKKLKEGFYGQEYIDEAISYVEGYGYVNDLQYALDFIAYRSTQLSKRQIEQKLLQKDVESSIISQAFSLFYEEGNAVAEAEQIRLFLEKKSFTGLTEEKQRQKVITALLRKGYPLEKIKKEIQLLTSEQ